MMMTASLEPGPGEGWAERRLAFCLFPQGSPARETVLFPTHSSQTAYVQGSGMLGANRPLLATMPLCSC